MVPSRSVDHTVKNAHVETIPVVEGATVINPDDVGVVSSVPNDAPVGVNGAPVVESVVDVTEV